MITIKSEDLADIVFPVIIAKPVLIIFVSQAPE